MKFIYRIHQKSTVILLATSLVLLSTGCGPGNVATPALPSATIVESIPPTGVSPTNTTLLTPTPVPTSTHIPTLTSIPTDTPTPFVPKATIHIALQSPLSGGYVDIGMNILHSAELATQQLARPLMELEYAIELVPFDDMMDVGTAIDNAQQIVADPEVLCVVGPFTSNILNQVKEIYHQAGLALISPSATAAYATTSGYLEVNRVLGRHDGQGIAGAQFAKEQGFTSVFVISQSNDYGQFNAYHFENEATRLGLSVVGNVTTDDTEDFDQQITSLIDSGAEIVFFSSMNIDQVGTFFRQARAAGYKGTFLGIEGIDTPVLLDKAGPLAVEDGGLYFTSITPPAIYYPVAAQFVEDFKQAWGVEPQKFAAQAYDAAGICLKAIEVAAQEGELPTRNEVANAIRSLEDYRGITGTFNFNQFGDPDPAQYFIFQVISPDPNDWSLNALVFTIEVTPP